MFFNIWCSTLLPCLLSQLVRNSVIQGFTFTLDRRHPLRPRQILITRLIVAASSSQQDAAITDDQLFLTFREAEIAGLRFMQQGSYTQAISTFTQALKLPGSKMDVVRSKLTPGPSPVGGAILGGTEGKVVYTLDEFEYQAVYYNLACAYSQLNQGEEVCLVFRNWICMYY